jgi:DNA-binding LytR/AlgR family response regulator
MIPIKVAIIEDEFFVANQLKDLATSLGFDVVSMHHSGEQFLKRTDWKFDVAIVDIFLSETLTGLDVGAALSQRNLPFIFLTANQDDLTLKEAAVLKPKAYISKPFQRMDVVAALEIIKAGVTPSLKLRVSHGQMEMNPAHIYYVKGDSGYVEIFHREGKFVQRKLLKELLKELPSQFVRVHRSYAINRDFIESKSATQVHIKGVPIPISRSFKDVL